MNQIDECIEALKTAIQESEEYKEYHVQLEEIKKDPEVYQRMGGFLRKNLVMQLQEGENSIEYADLQMEFADILANPQVRDYLRADRRLGKLMRKVSSKVMKSAGMDIHFLDE